MINIKSPKFESIYIDIRKRYLSNVNFPKLIVGTGLSIAMGIPGMTGLSKKLDDYFKNSKDIEIKSQWNQYVDKIKEDGLEAALSDLPPNEESLIEKIREITSEFILDEEYQKHFEIFNNKLGFEKLMEYLIGTVSVNDNLIDIMTPNYDRIVEMLCDKLKVSVTLGFLGAVYQRFDQTILKRPFDYYSKSKPLIRLFKPHGSVNWVKEDDEDIQTNDYHYLKIHKKNIDVIAPGSMKYKSGMTNEVFRCHREIFNGLITNTSDNYSIFIYGYGFNDPHFNSVFEKTKKDVIVLAKTIKKSFIEKAIHNENWTVFYKYEDNEDSEEKYSHMIYKMKKYDIDKDLWNIDIFSDIFI